MSEVLSVNQVHEMTGAHTDTIRTWISRGQLKAEKSEGRWYIKMSDLVEFAENKNNKKAAGTAKASKKEHLENGSCI